MRHFAPRGGEFALPFASVWRFRVQQFVIFPSGITFSERAPQSSECDEILIGANKIIFSWPTRRCFPPVCKAEPACWHRRRRMLSVSSAGVVYATFPLPCSCSCTLCSEAFASGQKDPAPFALKFAVDPDSVTVHAAVQWPMLGCLMFFLAALTARC